MASLGTKLSQSEIYSPPPPPVETSQPKHHHSGRSHWLFVIADFSSIASGTLLFIALRFQYLATHPRPFISVQEHLAVSTLYTALILLFCHAYGLYSVYFPLSRFHELSALVKSIVTATILLGGTVFLSGIKSTSRLVIAATAIYSLVVMMGWRLFRRWSLGKAVADGLSCHNVIIVGTNETALALAGHLAAHKHLGLVVIGHLGAPAAPQAEARMALKILGTPSDLKTLCRTQFADEVIICTNHRPTVIQAINDARECGLGVRVIPDLYDGLASGARLQYLGEFPSIAVVHRHVPAVSLKLKRALDVVVSAGALLFLSPLLLLLALVVKTDSPGSVLYASRRVGRKGRSFSCFKFRTMVADAEQLKNKLHHLNERDGVLFKIANDPRITRSGRFMRKYSLDELPQLLNVLKGDMSLVGPRPPLANEVKQYQLENLRRLEVAPGITGLWQVEARNHPSFDRYISLDLEYVENWSLGLDIHILLRTVAVVFAGTGS